MKTVAEACATLEERGLLERQKRNALEKVEPYVRGLIGTDLPDDLRDFYRENIYAVGEFRTVWPVWNDHVGWRTPDSLITELLHVQAVHLCRGRFTPILALFAPTSRRPTRG